MDLRLSYLFLISLFGTFIVTRILTHYMYNKGKGEKTITGAIRKRTPLDFHHLHMGALVLILFVPRAIINDVTPYTALALGFGASLIADQIGNIFLFKEADYFDRRSIIIAIIIHVIIALSVWIA